MRKCTHCLLLTNDAWTAEMMPYRNKRPLLWFLGLPKPEPAVQRLIINCCLQVFNGDDAYSSSYYKLCNRANIPAVYTRNANKPEAMTPIFTVGGVCAEPNSITGKVCHKALTKLNIACNEQHSHMSANVCWSNRAAMTVDWYLHA